MNGQQEHRMRPQKASLALLSISLAAVLVASACGGDGSAGATPGATQVIDQPKMIAQPVVPADVPVAPDSERVDLAMPTFSNPTNVTNPLFPVSSQHSVLLLGQVDGKPFRTEVTLLPYTRIIEWNGLQVEVLVSQYVAYLDGRLQEVAYDLYAQDDNGAVWYFGEDVADFEDGVIVTKEGTWLAGKDGPAAMIMPGDPQVGDVYRTENVPGFVFEEVTITAVDQTLNGPLGPIAGGLVAQELHMDGATEEKTFAPGYGEFYTAAGGDVEALALAVPTDALSEPVPAELTTLSTGALDVVDAAGAADWSTASATLDTMTAAWETYRAGGVPRLVEPLVTGALESLSQAVDAQDAAQASQAAIDVAQSSFDLQLRYRPSTEVDFARFDLWAAQLLLDAAAGDAGAVNGDVFTLVYVRDRILHTLDSANATRINTQLSELQVAAIDGDLAAAADAAQQLRDLLAGR